MTICNHCRHSNSDDANYCSSCGTPLALEPDEVTHTIGIVQTHSPYEGGEDSDATAVPAEESALLILRTGPEAGSWYGLDRPVITIGRHPNSDVFLNNVTVSRRHAEIRRNDDGYLLVDVGSLNGTYVNHQRVEEAQLWHGNEIQIGKYRFQFVRTPATGLQQHPG